jgi:hypothetical protein
MAWLIDDTNLADYGVKVLASTGLLDLPRAYDRSNDWLDLDGREHWQTNGLVKYRDRDFILNCYIKAESLEDFRTAVDNFYAFAAQGIHTLTTPYGIISNVAIDSEIIVNRRTDWNDTFQVGTFSLHCRVETNNEYQVLQVNHQSGSPVVAVIKTKNLQVTKTLQGDSYATCTAETSQPIGAHIYDYVNLNVNGTDNEKFYLSQEPELKKASTNKYIYNLKFEHGSGLLKQSQFLSEGESDFYFYGNMSDIVDLIVTNADRFLVNKFNKGTIADTINKNHKFSEENCYDVLRRIAGEYELEYEFQLIPNVVTYDINVVESVANDIHLTLEYGQGLGLYDIQREAYPRELLYTCLYAFGSTKNIPAAYRNGMRRLSFTANPLTKNTNLYLRIEKTVLLDDIYPQRTSEVTGYYQVLTADLTEAQKQVWPAGIYRIEDTDLGDVTYGFNLNDYFIGQTTAKVRMKTGDLAGFEFDIKRYDHDFFHIFIAPYTDENGKIYPNADLMIAQGDEYTLVDIDQPAVYVTEAEALLQAKAQELIDYYSIPRYPYRVRIDPAFMQANSGGIEVGDNITIVDTDFGLNEKKRISALTWKPLTNEYDLTLSDKRFLSRIEKIEKTVNATARAVGDTKKDTVEVMKKDQQTTGELRTKLLDPTGKLNVENIVRNESIDPRMLGFDAGTLQWSHKDLWLTPNYQNNEDKLHFTAGNFTVHNYNALDRYTIEQLKSAELDYIPDRTWNASATTITLANKNPHYIYAKVNTATGQTGCEIFCSEDRLEVKSETGFLIYQIGQISGGTEE